MTQNVNLLFGRWLKTFYIFSNGSVINEANSNIALFSMTMHGGDFAQNLHNWVVEIQVEKGCLGPPILAITW